MKNVHYVDNANVVDFQAMTGPHKTLSILMLKYAEKKYIVLFDPNTFKTHINEATNDKYGNVIGRTRIKDEKVYDLMAAKIESDGKITDNKIVDIITKYIENDKDKETILQMADLRYAVKLAEQGRINANDFKHIFTSQIPKKEQYKRIKDLIKNKRDYIYMGS